MTWRVSKLFRFSAAHQILTLPESHPCRRLHGHNYEVEVVCAADRLDEHGFVVDYAEVHAAVWPWIRDNIDHRHLNDALSCGGTSAETLAEVIHGVAAERLAARGNSCTVECVRVAETPGTWAEYRP